MRQQKIHTQKPAKQVQVTDNRPDPTPSDTRPLRVINYVEVGNMTPQQVQQLLLSLRQSHSDIKNHYFVPLRHGQIKTDVMIEKEFLDLVHKMCTVQDGQIVLREDAQDVEIIRRKI